MADADELDFDFSADEFRFGSGPADDEEEDDHVNEWDVCPKSARLMQDELEGTGEPVAQSKRQRATAFDFLSPFVPGSLALVAQLAPAIPMDLESSSSWYAGEAAALAAPVVSSFDGAFSAAIAGGKGVKLDGQNLRMSAECLSDWAAQQDLALEGIYHKLFLLAARSHDDPSCQYNLFRSDLDEWARTKLGMGPDDYSFSTIFTPDVMLGIANSDRVTFVHQSLPYPPGSPEQARSFTDYAMNYMMTLKPEGTFWLELNLFNVYFILWHWWWRRYTSKAGWHRVSIAGDMARFPNRICISFLLLVVTANALRAPGKEKIVLKSMKTMFCVLPAAVQKLVRATFRLDIDSHLYRLVASVNGKKSSRLGLVRWFLEAFQYAGDDVSLAAELLAERGAEICIWVNSE